MCDAVVLDHYFHERIDRGMQRAHTRTHWQIISMENNGIRAKGTYRDIETEDVKLIQEWNSIIAKENAQDESIRYLFFDFLRKLAATAKSQTKA